MTTIAPSVSGVLKKAETGIDLHLTTDNFPGLVHDMHF